MAPVAPLGKKGLLKALERGTLPIWFGTPHPFVAAVEQDGVFRLRALVVDPAEERAAHEKAMAEDGHWMPEHVAALGRPTGRIFLEASSLQELREKIGAFEWPADW